MSHFLIEPRDPMVVRDGRPNRGNSSSRTRDFPLPSALAGVVRTRLGSDADGAFELHGSLAALLEVGVRGPLLSALDSEGQVSTLYGPAPLDAVILESPNSKPEASFELHALGLRDLPDDARADRGDDLDPKLGTGVRDLALLGLDPEAPDGKAAKGAPVYWSFSDLLAWLGPRELDAGCWRRKAKLSELVDGAAPLPKELRTHVAIDSATGTGKEGMLFETEGLRFLRSKGVDDAVDATKQLDVTRLALAFETDEMEGRVLREGLFPFAGERRLMSLRAATSGWPKLWDGLEQHLRGGERCVVRVLLLTPAIFAAGFRPSETSPLLRQAGGLAVKLLAARTPAPIVVSGWDMAKRRPKPTRRAVPAGAVYWFELEGSADARVAWARQVWMKNMSCASQDRRDGWGMAMIGVAEATRGGES